MMKKDNTICPITKFIAWLILGLIVCIIGISNVFADEINFQVHDYQIYYDNNGSSVSQVGQTWVSSFNAYVSNNITTSANSYGAGVVISSGIPIISGHAYSLSFNFVERSNIALSSKNRIAIGSSVSNSASNYANGNYNATMITSKVINNTTLQFAFTANSSNQFIFIPWTTTSSTTQTYVFTSYIINDLGASSGVSESTINNSLNSQTNILNQSITNSQNAIIQNQNENNQALIDSNKELLGNCNKNLLSSSPVSLSGRNYNYSISLESGKTYNISTNGNIAICIHSGNFSCINELIFNSYGGGSYASNYNITGTSNSLYLSASSGTGWGNYDITASETMLSLGNSSTSFVPYGTEKCTSKLDETNNNLSNIFGSITNTDAANFDSSMINLIPNAPITNLLIIPISLMQSILTRTNNSCSPISIPFLYNNTIDFPCFTLSDYLGDASYIIDMCICFIMIYNILMLFVSVFEDITSLRDEFHTLYAPKQLQLKIK